jgi:glycosyltransferase involved in cell wall biosynthesis
MAQTKKKKSVSIIIPSYNEEKNIAWVIKDCKKLKKFFPIEIVVVDGGSKDKTVTVAQREGVDRIITFPVKRGKGCDFWVAGIASTGEYIVQIDADHQFQPDEIPSFVKELEKGMDVVIGTRFENGHVEEGSISPTNKIGNAIVSYAATLGAGIKITDVMAGFKAFRREAFMALDLRERHFEYEAETVVKAVRMGMKFKQLPITYTKRIGGSSGIRAIRDGVMVLLAILRTLFIYKPQPYNKRPY